MPMKLILNRNTLCHTVISCILLLLIGLVIGYRIAAKPPLVTQQHYPGNTKDGCIQNFGPYGIIATGGNNALVWDWQAKQVKHYLSQNPALEGIKQVKLANSAPIGVTRGPDSLTVWSLETGRALAIWKLERPIVDFTLANNGSSALVALDNQQLQLIDLKTGEAKYTMDQDAPITSIALTGDGHYALSGGENNIVKVWNLSEHAKIYEWPHHSDINVIEISDNGNQVLTGTEEGYLQVWNLNTGQLQQQLPSPPTEVTSADFSDNGKYLALATASQWIQIWDIHGNKLVTEWALPQPHFWKPGLGEIHSIVLHLDKHQIITENANGMGHIWGLAKNCCP